MEGSEIWKSGRASNAAAFTGSYELPQHCVGPAGTRPGANKILAQGTESVFAESGPRNVVIVYSGGDDVFLAGAWNEVIAAFMDLRKALETFTLGTLTISGGIGVYQDSYPIHVIAQETQFLEDCSKACDTKNAITIWNKDHCYPWPEFL